MFVDGLGGLDALEQMPSVVVILPALVPLIGAMYGGDYLMVTAVPNSPAKTMLLMPILLTIFMPHW